MKLVSCFSERFKEAMTLRQVRAIDVSTNTGISKPLISNYLKGKYKPKQEALVKIAKYLKVSEIWLMGYDEVDVERYPNTNEGKKREIIDLIHSIDDTSKLENIEKFIRTFVL